MVGHTISHYKILEKLGEGAMGEVYLAEDTDLGRRVALKFIPSSSDPNSENQVRLLQEARIAASLNHPGICAIHEIGETGDGRRFIAMDNPSAAARVADRIRSAVPELANQPGMGRPGRIPGTRERVLLDIPYIIAYRVEGNSVVILRVLHSSRKWSETIT